MSKPTATSTPRYPIRVVAERTGLTPATLRAWERRYGVVEPRRSQGDQRLYSDNDIRRLKLISGLSSIGYSLAQLSGYTTATLARMARQSPDGEGAHDSAPAPAPPAEAIVNRLLATTRALDPGGLRARLTQAVFTLGPALAFDTVISPFLDRVGTAWSCGEMSIAQEHLASGVVRDALGWVLQTATPSANVPTLIAACPSAELHEFGAMMAAVTAAVAGWRVLYLGPNLPAAEIARVAALAKASVVAVSLVGPQPSTRVRDEMSELRARLGDRAVVLAGGAGAGDHRLSLRRSAIEMVDSRAALSARLAGVWERR